MTAPRTKAELAAEYVKLIGYDPFEDDPTITIEAVEQTLKEWHLIEAHEARS